MANAMQLMPTLESDEMTFVQGLIKDMPDNQAQQFANAYLSRRKNPQTILLVSLIGFFGVAGIQRFMLEQVGMGVLYLLTAGLCFIGTIIDLVNHKKMSFEYNSKAAQQVAAMVKAAG